MPMSGRLLRPRASGPTHPEAKDWVSRVVANGGTVGSSTAAAVDKFCRAIDATSGLRAAILRLNLFCGNSDASLNAVRTPLYRSGSFGGAAIGNAMDTNVNFAQADFQETGSGGGLVGNGSTKYLDTGFQPANWSSRTDIHMSYSGTGLETSGDKIAIGSIEDVFPASEPKCYILDIYAAYVTARAVRFSAYTSGPRNFPSISSPGSTESHLLGVRTSASNCVLYRAGVSAASATQTITTASTSRPIYVFALNSSGTAGSHTAARLRMYSIGNGMTAAQALAFSNAVIAFNTALGRA